MGLSYKLHFVALHRHPDLYHSCYCLSGLALAQNHLKDAYENEKKTNP